jgi:hypothetical protein
VIHAGSSEYMEEIKNAHKILSLGVDGNKIRKMSLKIVYDGVG